MDIASTVRMMGGGIFVMLFGTVGVVLGAPIAYLLVPASILMALIGYAIGNYGAFAAAWLCYWLSQ